MKLITPHNGVAAVESAERADPLQHFDPLDRRKRNHGEVRDGALAARSSRFVRPT